MGRALLLVVASLLLLLPSAVSAISFDREYTDATGDAAIDGSPSATARQMGDIVGCGSSPNGDNVDIRVTMAGDIRDSFGFSVTVQIDNNSDERGDLVVSYSRSGSMVSCVLLDQGSLDTIDVNYTIQGKTLTMIVPVNRLECAGAFDIMVSTTVSESIADMVVDSCHVFGMEDSTSTTTDTDEQSPMSWALALTGGGAFVALFAARRRR